MVFTCKQDPAFSFTYAYGTIRKLFLHVKLSSAHVLGNSYAQNLKHAQLYRARYVERERERGAKVAGNG